MGIKANYLSALGYLKLPADNGDMPSMSAVNYLTLLDYRQAALLPEIFAYFENDKSHERFSGLTKGEKSLWALLIIRRLFELPWDFPVSVFGELCRHSELDTLPKEYAILTDTLYCDHQTIRAFELLKAMRYLLNHKSEDAVVISTEFHKKLDILMKVFRGGTKNCSRFFSGMWDLLSGETNEPILADALLVGFAYARRQVSLQAVINYIAPDDRALFLARSSYLHSRGTLTESKNTEE